MVIVNVNALVHEVLTEGVADGLQGAGVGVALIPGTRPPLWDTTPGQGGSMKGNAMNFLDTFQRESKATAT